MKRRILYLAELFGIFIVFFFIQKIIFTATNASTAQSALTTGDYMQILWHGCGLDLSTTGYLLTIPFLLVWASTWTSALNLRKILAPYFIIVSLILSTISIADTSLYDFWKFKIDATIFNYIDAPKQAMASVTTGYIVWRLCLIGLFTAALSYATIRITPSHLEKLKLNLGMAGKQTGIILLGGVIFLMIRGGVGRSTMNIGSAYFSEDAYLNHAAVNPTFNLIYSWRKSENFAEKYNYLSEEELKTTYNGLYPEQTEDCTEKLLVKPHPQVLIIVLEGFGGDYIGALGGHGEVSPNFARLIKEGIFFDQVYANSFRTDRGLVSALSGHISYPTTSIMKIPAKSQYLPGIASTLKQNGYETTFMYGGDINFTNMKSYFTTTGYQELISDVDFSLTERTSSSWGAHDEYTFNRLYELIKSKPLEKPWHIGLLTLSSHEPFIVPYKRLADKRLNAFAYTDHCLGQFIDKLKELPVWNNLLVVCLPDHGSSSSLNVTSPDFYHIPMLWLGGAIGKPQVIHTLMNQNDMPATLLGQLGLPHKDFKYSRNIFSKQYTYPFAYSTFSDGFMFKDSTGVTIFDNVSKKALVNTPDNNQTRETKGKAILQWSYDELSQ